MMAKHSRRSRGRGTTEQRTNFVVKIDAESSLSDEFDCYKLTFRTACGFDVSSCRSPSDSPPHRDSHAHLCMSMSIGGRIYVRPSKEQLG